MIWQRTATPSTLPICAPPEGGSFPLHTDWAWRPEVFTAPIIPARHVIGSGRTDLADGLALFHDGKAVEAVAVQESQEGAARFGISVDIAATDASYLSLAANLPDLAAQTLTERHILRIETDLRRGGIGNIWVRLNMVHGPNARQIVSEIPVSRGGLAEFDMFVTGIATERPSRAWLDLIFGTPGPGRFAIRDLVISRRPRAEF